VFLLGISWVALVLFIVVGSHGFGFGLREGVVVCPHLRLLCFLLVVDVGLDGFFGVGLLGHREAIAVLVAQHEMVRTQVVLLLIVELGVLHVGPHWVVILKGGLVVIYLR
jgi:hypothetical protein